MKIDIERAVRVIASYISRQTRRDGTECETSIKAEERDVICDPTGGKGVYAIYRLLTGELAFLDYLSYVV